MSEGSPAGAVRAVAAVELRDGVRARRALVLRAVTPVLLAGLVLTVALLVGGARTGTRDQAYRVAVEGDLAGAAGTLGALDPERLRFEPTDDAALATARGADLGLRVPVGLDAAVGAGRPAEVELYTSATAPGSRSAAALVRSGLAARHADAVRRAQSGTPRITIEAIDVQRTTTGTRLLVAGLVAAVVVLQAATLTGATATRFLGRRGRGLLAAQLLLPVGRRQVAMAKGMAELVLGLLTSGPVVGAAVVLIGVTVARRDSLGAGLAAVAAVVAAAVVLSAFMTAVGLLLGALARSQEQVTLVAAVVVISSAACAAVAGLAEARRPALLALVPVLGVVGSLRDLLDAALPAPWFLLSVVSTTAATVLLVRLAGRRFESEAVVLRS